MKKRYSIVVLGGTFDRIHKGHEVLLSKAFAIGNHVIVGLTSDTYVKKFKNYKFPSERLGTRQIKNFEARKADLCRWLIQKNWFNRSSIVPLDDPYGPSQSNKEIEAIIVSEETEPRVGEIQVLRQRQGLKPLDVVVIPTIVAEDKKLISSTRVRKGEIDANGNLFLPDSLRPELRIPLGVVLSQPKIFSGRRIITVGDIATKTVLDAGIIPYLSIIDGKVGRQVFPDAKKMLDALHLSTIHVVSGPGFISIEAIDAISSAKHKVIMVTGEEDLLVLPAIVHAPKGSIVYYGQPGEGMVKVKVNDDIQDKVRILLSRFI